MESDTYSLYLYILGGITFFYTFFSTFETVVQALTETDKRELRENYDRASQRVLLLLQKPHITFISFKIATLVTAVAVIGGVTLTVQSIAHTLAFNLLASLALALVFMTSIYLVLWNWIKKILQQHRIPVARHLSFPAFIFFQIVRPFTLFLNRLLKLSNKFPFAESINLNPEAIISIVEESENGAELEDSQKAMIHSIFQFGETEVHTIMVPRPDMVCVEETVDIDDLIELISEKGHSRIPLYNSEGVDNITGILYAKDLLPYTSGKPESLPDLQSLARPVYFVPETKKLRQLLKEFQDNKYHMAVVVDEYGGTAGLVTLEDVIEEIVGDIQDEFDQELPLYRKLDDDQYLVEAKIDLNELNTDLGFDLPTEGDYESLAGFILSLTGYVPENKEEVKYENYSFIIEEIERNRIIKVKLTRHNHAALPDEEPDNTGNDD